MDTKGVILTFDFRFVRELRRELNALARLPSLREISPGLLLAEGEGSGEFWQELQRQPPIFLRHMFPLQKILSLEQDLTDLSYLAQSAAALAQDIPQKAAVAVQCRIVGEKPPYKAAEIKGAVDLALAALSLLPETKHPHWVVSILFIDNMAYLGVSTPAQNLSRWSGGAVHYGKPSGMQSRAEHKIEEACELLGVALTASGRVLDLGAAPGGWTSFLLKQGHTVTAVDTGELDPKLLQHPRLTFLKQNAWQLRLPPDSFDFVTCDIGRDALRTVEILLYLAPCLRDNGNLLMTVKFMGRDPLPLIKQCLGRLSPSYRFIRGRHLWHNREEVTLYFVKREV